MKRIVGTPDYLAPELIKDGNININVDWWAVGVIAYELMTGVRPFGAESISLVFENIVNMRIIWPEVGEREGEISKNGLDFMMRLLDPNPNHRLGTRGSKEVKTHPFFRDIQWSSLREDESPFIPQINDELDTQYFNQEKNNFETNEFLKEEPLLRQRSLFMPNRIDKESNCLSDFEATMYPTLVVINRQIAQDAKSLHEKEVIRKTTKKRKDSCDHGYSIEKLDKLKNVDDQNPLTDNRSNAERKNKDNYKISLFNSGYREIDK